MREADFKRRILNEVQRCNALVFHIVASKRQEPGWPDEYVSHTKYHGFLEFKGERTRLGLKQKIIIRGLRERGDNAYIVRAPCYIEDHEGNQLHTFDGTGKDLLEKLAEVIG